MVLLLDSDVIAKHLQCHHKISHKDYNASYMQTVLKPKPEIEDLKTPKVRTELNFEDELEEMSASNLLDVIDKVLEDQENAVVKIKLNFTKKELEH